MSEHQTANDTQIRRTTTTPALAPDFTGEALAEINSSSNVGSCFRVASATTTPGNFQVVCFTPQGSAGDPNGVRTSRCARDLCVDTVNHRLYFSLTTNSTSWSLRVPGEIPGGGGGGYGGYG